MKVSQSIPVISLLDTTLKHKGVDAKVQLD